MRESMKRAIKKYQQKIRQEMLEAYGSICSCCQESHKEFLTLEHINGSGAEHRRKVGGGMRVLFDLRKRGWPKEGFTVLCMNCNWATRFNTICPHHYPPK